MIITLDDAKNFLRVDFTDDDTLIQTLVNAATDYITNATGIVFDSTNNRAQTVCLMLVAEWYSNREITRQLDAGPTSVLNTLLTQLAMAPDSVIPLQVPIGLTAVAEPGYAHLRWLANIEPNVDGYNVYRDGVKLNVDLIRESDNWVAWPLAWGDWPYPLWESRRHSKPGVMAYEDSTAQAGQTYSYQVAAVDGLGNESAKTAAVQVTM